MKIFKGTKLTWLILALMGVVAVLIGFIFPAGEGEHGFAWTYFNGFYALLGFIGCVVMIYIAKWLGHYWLQKKEDYYD
jgi:hypothetical protein